ncbi:MAG: hypothetical protein AAF682_20390 [Planctomycetota bacterium]
MLRTARRRWTREMDGEIDGIALGDTGPLLLHGYTPPAGGKWKDDVIPGRLGAYDRQSGKELWVSPCEVGYGRGFGAGLGDEDDVVVLGPGSGGHLIARMSLSSGELLGAESIEPFDQAVVGGDLCMTLTPGRVTGLLTGPMLEVWSFRREGERYHLLGRDGAHVFVLYTDNKAKRQGVLRVEVESGEFVSELLPPELAVVHDMAVGGGVAVLLVGEGLKRAAAQERLFLLGVSTTEDGTVLWRDPIPEEGLGGMPDVSIRLDDGKLYVARDSLLDVRDVLTGRQLGEVTVPGLDEHIAWHVSQGAGLLAEETRVSVFEIPD